MTAVTHKPVACPKCHAENIAGAAPTIEVEGATAFCNNCSHAWGVSGRTPGA